MSEPAPKAARGRPSTLNAGRVLEVAVTAYRHEHPIDVSGTAICRLAGVSKLSLYREFASKDGLKRAALDSSDERVLADVLAIAQGGQGLQDTLDALVQFAGAGPRMEPGCLFHKMRAGKHRLGPETSARVEELDASAQTACEGSLQACRDASDWPAGLSVEAGARYRGKQVALASTPRASGDDPARIGDMPGLALSPFSRHGGAALR
jgi:AcrR family transcriptional regulator